MDSLDRPSDIIAFRTNEILCPACSAKGITIGGSDREVDLACNMCGHEWTAARQHPLTPYNRPE